jgi:hypothetical protein
VFGSRLRALWMTSLVASLLTAAACESKPHDLSFEVSFVCPEDQAASDTLELHVLEGGCDGAERVYEASLSPGELAPLGKSIDPGRYGFEAIALRAGEALASGCVEATLPSSQAPIIALRSDTCVEAVEADAAADAGSEAGGDDMDAETLDAELDGDAEPDGDVEPVGDADAAPQAPDAGVDVDASASADAGADATQDANSADAAPLPCATDCRDSFPCTEDRCVNGECVHEPYTGARECDGVACTQSDRCDSGNCLAGAPNDGVCPDDGNPCTAEICEPGSGCNRQNAPNTTSCNDQIGCTGPDRCNNGACRGPDMCSTGVCSAVTRMCTECTGPSDCSDGDACTDDACSGGRCSHTRVVGRANACSDNRSCTNNDLCTANGCAGTSTCPSDGSCGGSSCRCNDSSETYCGSSNTCANLTSDAANCGQCDRACANSGSCERSACKPSDASNCSAWRFNGHEYLICAAVNNTSTWTWARDKCKNWGLGLVIIDDEDENGFLTENSGGTDHWIAANDRGDNGSCGNFLGGCNGDSRECTLNQEEGNWYWASSAGDNFRKFCTQEPNNDSCSCGSFGGNCSEGEDCGVLYADGTWNDGRCSNVLGFICETP